MGRHSSLARACRDALKFMTQHEVRYTTATDQMQKPTAWVFLGPPVSKLTILTFKTIDENILNVSHLVRHDCEMSRGSGREPIRLA